MARSARQPLSQRMPQRKNQKKCPQLYLHHGDRGVDFRRQGNVDLVLGAVDAHTHALLHVRRRHLVVQGHDEFGNLLDVDHVPDGRMGGCCHLEIRPRTEEREEAHTHTRRRLSSQRLVHALVVLFALAGDNLRAHGDLQRVLLLHHLLVGGEVPQPGVGQASGRLLDARALVDAL